MRPWLPLMLALATVLSGCASDAPPARGADADAPDAADAPHAAPADATPDADDGGSVACADGEVYHPYEDRCLPGRSAPHNERCNVFLRDGGQDRRTLYCEASSDGHATAAVTFDGTGSVTVYVRDATNALVAQQTYGPGTHDLSADGEGGRWRLAVDFGDATGPVVVDLWG